MCCREPNCSTRPVVGRIRELTVMYHKLCFFVPESHVEAVKDAVFAAGAGCLGAYEHCSWQTIGEGQFRPGKGSTPYIGHEGTVERVQEFRVETVCADEFLGAAVRALVEAHPYETPAYEHWPVHLDPPQ